MYERYRKLQKINLDILSRNDGLQFTNTFFPYPSGQIGPYDIQSIVVEKNGKDYETAINSLKELITGEGFLGGGVISGGESEDWNFSNPVAYALRMPHAKICKDGRIFGADINKKNINHVASTNDEDSLPKDIWAPAIRKLEGIIRGIFFYVDRMENGTQAIEELGLKSHAVVYLNKDAWNYLEEKKVITPEFYKILRNRMKDKDTWAKNMLRSEKGLKTLANLLNNPITLNKGMKILDKGYPDISLELQKRLTKGNMVDSHIFK
ncbi:hypothetical protein CMI39_00645 [Candidatus Pacearchaeota archaeon]|jgi:hypothetical protein|nr:hypothetical protein [Candidatus Pacearchaeota archaeon]|tara:strand:+ start:230 stop:1024 length:795 start_codon:yes stop_codon:yes gene_type:complete